VGPKRLEHRIRRQLQRLSLGARQELLRVLASPSGVRADLIRQMYERPATRYLAEVLMDLEAEPDIRLQLWRLSATRFGGRKARETPTPTPTPDRVVQYHSDDWRSACRRPEGSSAP
jgi:hypothetical protein